MNKIWVFMIIISVIIGMFQGLAPEMVNSIFDSTKSATENCILNDPISMTDEITHPSLLYN